MEIDISIPKDEFNKFISNEYNSRILFSAKFGMGKTYFLKEFFKENNEYESFHLYPINYQVCNNDDIFELIKFDILLKLIDKEWINSDKKTNHSLALQSFLINGGADYLSPIIKMIPKIGGVFNSINKIFAVFEEYQKYVKNLNNATLNVVNNFGTNISNKKGSIYEQDSITNIIIDSISNNKKDKATVLIVDDLDRIDPEYIFRILNIFSAHFDLDTANENKFGFDKIIIVCDIDNIKKIFHAKYGKDTDFEGYIDKFYSNSCYHFSNQKSVLNYLGKNLFNKINNNLNYSIYIDEMVERCVKHIIIDFINFSVFNLRDLLKINNTTFDLQNFSFIYGSKNLPISSSHFKVITIFQCLDLLFGNNHNKIIQALTICSKKTNLTQNINNMVNQIVLLAFPFEKINFDGLSVFEENTLGLIVRFHKISKSSKYDYYDTENLIFKDFETDIEKKIKPNQIYYLLLKAYENYINIIKFL